MKTTKKTRKPGSSGQAAPDYWNCFTFDGQKLIPGISVTEFGQRKRLGVNLAGSGKGKPCGGILLNDRSEPPEVIKGRLYNATLFDGALIHHRNGGRCVIVVTPPVTSVRFLQASPEIDAQEVSIEGAIKSDACVLKSGQSAPFAPRAPRLLLSIPYEGQDDRGEVAATPMPAVRLRLLWQDRSVVIALDPSHENGPASCRVLAIEPKKYAQATRSCAASLSRRLRKANKQRRRKFPPLTE